MDIVEILSTYSGEVISAIRNTDMVTLAKMAEILFRAKDQQTTIYTVGNGGSAATASHICNDLLKGCGVCGNPGYKAECLCDSTAVLTCLANDFDYESVFSIQLRAKAKAGDILIAYSGSGNSPNILKAVAMAKEKGMMVLGFTGRDGGKLAPMCDVALIAPTDSMEQIEDLHMLYVHVLSHCLQKLLTEKNGQ